MGQGPAPQSFAPAKLPPRPQVTPHPSTRRIGRRPRGVGIIARCRSPPTASGKAPRVRLGAPRPPRSGARQRSEGPRARGAHRSPGVGVVLVPGRVQGRAAGPDRRLPLGRAHELQGHREHSRGRVQGADRPLRGFLERLYLDRPDRLRGDRDPRRPRRDAVPRGRADGPVPLRRRGVRGRAHRHRLRAAGRRERPRAAPRHRGHRHRVQGPSLPSSHHRVAGRSARDDPRRPLRPLPPPLHAGQRHSRHRGRRRRGRGVPRGRAALRLDRGGDGAAAGADDGARADRGARARDRARRRRRLSEGRLARAGRRRPRLRPHARARCRADRRQGVEPLVQLSRSGSPAPGPALPGPSSTAGTPPP